jgi:large subunit ribosomal protein L21
MLLWLLEVYHLPIIESGGKQYKVAPGETVDVDLLDKAEGDKVELERVLMIADDDRITVGTPTIEGAKVMATSKGLAKGKKIIVLRYKHKNRYAKKTGHRSKYTRLTIDDIIAPEGNKN